MLQLLLLGQHRRLLHPEKAEIDSVRGAKDQLDALPAGRRLHPEAIAREVNVELDSAAVFGLHVQDRARCRRHEGGHGREPMALSLPKELLSSVPVLIASD
jgi:hypothetical protein